MKPLFNIKSYFTFLSRNKVYAAINVFGLSVSFSFVVLIGLYYLHETGIDRHIEDGDSLYSLCAGTEENRISGTSREVIPLLQKQLPQIAAGCALYADGDVRIAIDAQGGMMKVNMLFADSTFCRFFHPEMAEGSPEAALASVDDVMISTQLARRLFPLGNALSGTIVTADHRKLHVKGVFEKPVETSLPDVDVIGRYEQLREKLPYFFNINGNFGSPDVVLKLKSGTDVAQLEQNINKILKPIYEENFRMKVTFRLLPFSASYFSDYSSNVCRRGNVALVYFIFFIGIVILLFSMMNYINLTTALTGQRSHEMATRRLLGSHTWEVRMRLVFESICLCLCSVVLSVVLAWAFVPAVNNLLDTTITLRSLFGILPLGLLAAFVLVVGALAGVLPAFIMSRVKPVDVVRGTFRRQTKMVFGKVFIIVQNVITISCIALAFIFSMQIRHLINAPLGYDTGGMMEINVPTDARKAELFKKSLLRLGPVKGVSVCMCSPLMGGFNQMAYVNNNPVRCQRFYADDNYLSLLGIKIHRQFTQGDSVSIFVTPDFHAKMGLKPDARTFRYNENYDEDAITGITDDFRLMTVTHDNSNEVAVVYLFKKLPDQAVGSVLVKTEGDCLEQVREVYRSVYHEDMVQDAPYLSQQIENAYSEQSRMAHLLTIFSFVAILISLLGLIAMSTYFIGQRSKEIALRKVFGSTSNRVRLRLIRTFLNYVLIAFVVSVPVVWYVAGEWISRYSYRITWWYWIPVAGIIVWLVSFAAVVVQSYVASNENPVKHIKDNQ